MLKFVKTSDPGLHSLNRSQLWHHASSSIERFVSATAHKYFFYENISIIPQKFESFFWKSEERIFGTSETVAGNARQRKNIISTKYFSDKEREI